MLFMSFRRARRCRAQCDVLMIPQLATILPHIFLSHVCACSSCVVSVLVLLLTINV